MESKWLDRSANLVSMLALVAAAVTGGYRVWHKGVHHPTMAEKIAMPQLNPMHYSDAPLGTYIVTFTTQCLDCGDELGFYEKLVGASRKGRMTVKVVLAYPEKDQEALRMLKARNLDLSEIVPVSHVPRGPTLYFVDTVGTVRGYWQGHLKENDQARILQAF